MESPSNQKMQDTNWFINMIDANINFSDMEVLFKMIIFHLLFEASKEAGLDVDLSVQFNLLKAS